MKYKWREERNEQSKTLNRGIGLSRNIYRDIGYCKSITESCIKKIAISCRYCSFFFFLNGSLSSSDEPSSSSGDETDFLPMGSVSADSGGMSNMLLISTTMRMIYGVHSHSSNSGPASSLCFVFVVLATGLANWLVGSSTSSNNSNHSSAVTWDRSSAATWESDSGLSSIISVTDDNG